MFIKENLHPFSPGRHGDCEVVAARQEFIYIALAVESAVEHKVNVRYAEKVQRLHGGFQRRDVGDIPLHPPV